MADFLSSEVVQSIAYQAAINTQIITGTGENFQKFLSEANPPQLPANESVDDSNMVGDGFSRTERQLFNYRWLERNFPFQHTLNDHISSILAINWAGGALVETPYASPNEEAKEVTVVQNVANTTPKLIQIYRHLGAEKFLQLTHAVNNFTISQEGEDRPTASFETLGTGKFLYDTAIDTELDDAEMLDPPDYNYFHGQATKIVATDDQANSYAFHTEGTLLSLSVEGSNNVSVARRPTGTFLTSGNRNSGSIAGKIRNGRTTGSIRLKIDLGSTLREFKAMVANAILSGLKITFVGFDVIAGTVHDYEWEVEAPKAQFETIEGDSDSDYGALSLVIRPVRDPVTLGRYKFRFKTLDSNVLDLSTL